MWHIMGICAHESGPAGWQYSDAKLSLPVSLAGPSCTLSLVALVSFSGLSNSTAMNSPRKPTHIVDEKGLPVLPEERLGSYSHWKSWIRRVSTRLWVWEFASLLMSTLCVGAILAIMVIYNNRPIPDWSYGLTMNGVISILAVVSKSSLILPLAEALSQLKWCWFWNRDRPVMDFDRFDLASRGPWGSLTMLLHIRLWYV